ncbi:hypothetical protein HanIR_Chr17g0883681 [Helianthus annuus]|nr:hypothetical protein HanIR_Chr17g0883681 [Helianthus annuus]
MIGRTEHVRSSISRTLWLDETNEREQCILTKSCVDNNAYHCLHTLLERPTSFAGSLVNISNTIV